MTPVLIAVMGPTGAGKSALAESLAKQIDAQLINADAFQVYRGMDVGTNKPIRKNSYALLDLAEPTDSFGVGEWVSQAHRLLADLWTSQRSAIVVGGSGLYVRALFEEYADMKGLPDTKLRQALMEREKNEGLDALANELVSLDPATTVDLKNPVRVRRALERLSIPHEKASVALPPFKKVKVALNPGFDVLEPLLYDRVERMLGNGWPEEVVRLLEKGVPLSAPGFRAIGYQSVSGFLLGETDLKSTTESIFRATRQYAKRQKTWLRSEPNLIELSIKFVNDLGTKQALGEALQIVSGLGVSE